VAALDLWLEPAHPIQRGWGLPSARQGGLQSLARKEELEEGNRWEKGNHINMQRECSRFIAAK